MNFKKAVKKIKKLVRESENPFVEECVSVFESRGLDGGKLLKVNFIGVSKYGENVEYRVQLDGESCFVSAQPDVGIERYRHLEDILSLDSIDELVNIAVPRLNRVSFGRFTSVSSPDSLRESASWEDYLGSGRIHDLSAIQVSKLAQRDIRGFVRREMVIKHLHDRSIERFRGRVEELEACIESMKEEG